MPTLAPWPEHEIQQLLLTEHEVRVFSQVLGDLDTAVLRSDLHGWGNQLIPWICGCRRAAFTNQRIQSRGIHTVLIKSGEQYRHVHPAECALLNGLHPGMWVGNCRLGLALVGQLASPIQSVWIMMHVQAQAHTHYTIQPPKPETVLQAYKALLLQARDEVWTTCADRIEPRTPPGASPDAVAFRDLADDLPEDCLEWTPQPSTASATVPTYGGELTNSNPVQVQLLYPGEPPVRVACQQHDEVTVGQILQAESLLHGVPVHLDDTEEEDVQVRDGQIIKVRQGPSEHAAPHPIRELLAAATPAISLVDPSRTPSPITRSEQRLQVLAQQGALWADDEIRLHLRQLTRACPSVDQWLEPLAASNLRSRDDEDQVASWLQTNDLHAKHQAVIVSVVRAQAHWIPVVWVKRGATLEIVLCSSNKNGAQALQKASDIIGHDLKVDHRVGSSWPHEACGFRAIYWLWQYLGPSVALPNITYHALRAAFSTAVADHIMCRGPLVLAAGNHADVQAPTDEDGPEEATASTLGPADQVTRWCQVLANRVQRLHSAENPVLLCPAHEHIGKRYIPTTMRIEMLDMQDSLQADDGLAALVRDSSEITAYMDPLISSAALQPDGQSQVQDWFHRQEFPPHQKLG